jgi:hypothetical protein
VCSLVWLWFTAFWLCCWMRQCNMTLECFKELLRVGCSCMRMLPGCPLKKLMLTCVHVGTTLLLRACCAVWLCSGFAFHAPAYRDMCAINMHSC